MFKLLGISEEQNQKRNKNKIMAKPMRSAHQTWAELSSDEAFQKFFKGFLELLQNKLSKQEVIGHNYSYVYFAMKNLVLWDRRRSRIAGVRVLRLCLGVWCLKQQIPSTT